MDATLVAAALFASGDGGGFELVKGAETYHIAGRFRREANERNAAKLRFATVYLRREDEALMEVRAGEEFVLRRLPDAEVEALRVYGEPATIKRRHAKGQGARMVGLMVEIDGGLGAA
ncbi:hypothetical protein [Pararhodobacter sp. CCB-MM2]|uniref:hypothetical protein n=1 Tax=Pararhodobacter sp. CCB-MM2 TaxID=1786003 RepID=UPI00082973FF|nr:hypothetical protein [Pararhodobacter sp. CCB-MM2]